MNDEELNDVWTTLEPTVSQRRRINVRLSTRLEAHDTPLAAEWLALLKVSPFATIGLATVSAVAIAATPLVWFARALM
jgi:hypothetical protein